MEKIELKHTPAPWTLHENWQKARAVPPNDTNKGFAYKHSFIYGSDGLILGEAKALEGDGFAKFDVYEANALLLCAAPLLISALMDAVKETNEYCHAVGVPLPGWISDAKAAIAKATNTTEP